MTQTAYPKVGGATTDGQYRELFRNILETGALSTSGYAATADSSGMNVKVAAGLAIVDGIVAKSSAVETLTIAPSSGGTLSRVDTVVLQLDYSTDPIIRLVVIPGTAANTGSQVAPSLAPTGTVQYNWPIANVAVAPTAVTIAAGNITDRRTFSGSNVGLWTTGLRPPAKAGLLGFNGTTGKWEGSNGSTWAELAPSWADIPGKPATFPPTAHNHLSYDITVAGTTQLITDWVQALVAQRAPLAHTHQYNELRVDSRSIVEWVDAFYSAKGHQHLHTDVLVQGVGNIADWVTQNFANKASVYPAVRAGGGSGMQTNNIYIGWNGSGLLAQVDSSPIGAIAIHGSNVSFGQIYSPAARATPVTNSYVAAYINGDGRIGASASSRRFKKEIKSWSPDKQAVLAMQLVTFRYKAAVYGDGTAPVEAGLIAEELVDLGLDWLVFHDDDGLPAGIHYDRIALALLPVVQDHEDRIAALEARLDAASA
jgi:hypothetical protein